MVASLRIIVTGLIAQYPLGGVTWDYFQYVLGLARLGHDVYYLEDTGQWPYNPHEGGVSKGCEFNVEYLAGLMPVHKFMTHAAYFTAAIQILFLINLFWSMKKGPKAPMNPWNSTSLEWSIPSPPPFDNFAGVHPVVNHGPYEFSVPGAPNDYIMQNDPPSEHVEH